METYFLSLGIGLPIVIEPGNKYHLSICIWLNATVQSMKTHIVSNILVNLYVYPGLDSPKYFSYCEDISIVESTLTP